MRAYLGVPQPMLLHQLPASGKLQLFLLHLYFSAFNLMVSYGWWH